ncbi:methyl-accepting chemotaxis protein [Fontisphaera persica]|uniref:methyl-accepting chemotaxis protein n=1 Tax=Fontisphaera persica TaxID=2974023 RepID=UPI0024C04CA0|nr:methyl-accepting chemotaxis protein [Fontisphaera persica]WCJ58237.1 methyl-accepting chemotaxis protein [Fontisphaera persica]
MKIRTKIIALGAGLAVSMAAVLVAVILLESRQINQRVQEAQANTDKLKQEMESELRRIMWADLEKSARSIYTLLEASDKRTERRLLHALGVAHQQIEEAGGFRLANTTVPWTVVNQFNGEQKNITLPGFCLGQQWLGQVTTTNQPAPLVDFVKQTTRDYCTIFQRMNEEGDMLRVCTSVLKTNGTRAIGTYIPRMQPDGTENPVLKAVLSGQTYRGRAFVVDDWHAAVYEPIWDEKKEKVIGMLYTGVSLRDVNLEVARMVQQTRVGKTGNVVIVGGTGSQRGVYIISKDGKRDGENIWEVRDAKGRPFVQETVNKAVAAKGEPVFDSYEWRNPGETTNRVKVAALMYYEPWNWVINAGCYEDEYMEVRNSLQGVAQGVMQTCLQIGQQFRGLLRWTLGVAAVGVVVALVCGFYVAGRIVRPINQGVAFTQRLAQGDFSRELEIHSKDETGELAQAMNEMVRQLRRMFRKVQQSSTTLQAQSSELVGSGQQMGATAEETASQANVVAGASEQVSKSVATVATAAEEISASIKEIARQAVDAAKVANQAATAAERANQTMGRLDASSAEINNVVKVITSIAEQTNLLALNATIEAARAGEAGKGFAVVANEVKELAKQTARATEEIAVKIQTIQGDSHGAVEAIREIGEVIRKIDQIQTVIASAVEEQAATMNEITRNAAEAAQGSQEIARNIAGVSQAAQSTTQAAAESLRVAQDLGALAQELQAAAAQFKLGSEAEAGEGSQSQAAVWRAPGPARQREISPRRAAPALLAAGTGNGDHD